MKAVMLSIQPKWCAKIASGEKTIEVRKTKPKLETPFKCYIYQTKRGWIYKLLKRLGLYQGKVIGEFVCDNILSIESAQVPKNDENYENRKAFYDSLALTQQTCISYDEWSEYVGYGITRQYGWHISQLKIYDTPRELNEFYRLCNANVDSGKCWNCLENGYQFVVNGQRCCKITCPPQSYYYIEE